MGKLLTIRHGQSTWNAENRFTGWVDVGTMAIQIAKTKGCRVIATGSTEIGRASCRERV